MYKRKRRVKRKKRISSSSSFKINGGSSRIGSSVQLHSYPVIKYFKKEDPSANSILHDEYLRQRTRAVHASSDWLVNQAVSFALPLLGSFGSSLVSSYGDFKKNPGLGLLGLATPLSLGLLNEYGRHHPHGYVNPNSGFVGEDYKTINALYDLKKKEQEEAEFLQTLLHKK